MGHHGSHGTPWDMVVGHVAEPALLGSPGTPMSAWHSVSSPGVCASGSSGVSELVISLQRSPRLHTGEVQSQYRVRCDSGPGCQPFRGKIPCCSWHGSDVATPEKPSLIT